MANWGNITFPNKQPGHSKKSRSSSKRIRSTDSRLSLDFSGDFGLRNLGGDFVESIAASAVSSVANKFKQFLRGRYFGANKMFENQTGETKDSIDVYRGTAKKPTFVVKAGVGIRGSLNYLAGLYKGQVNAHTRTRSGKTFKVKAFSYYKQRDLIETGWRDFGGDANIVKAYYEKLQKKIQEAGV